MDLPRIVMPDPKLASVDNQTSFPHMAFFKMGPGRRFYDVLVVRGSFDLAEGRMLQSPKQSSPVLADVCWDSENAPHSSLKEAGDVLLYKPGTDVFVTGTARLLSGQRQERWLAGVMVMRQREAVLRQFLQLTGPRYWQYGFFKGWHLTAPEAADAVPLRYELAYGGARLKPHKKADTAPEWETYKANPSGTGFFEERTMAEDVRYPGPQIEDPAHPIRRINKNYPLTGFGPVARFWQGRSQYAGTYDLPWIQQYRQSMSQGICPDYPPDFDARFFQCAHPSLVASSHLRGNEAIGLEGMLPDMATCVCELPALELTTLFNASDTTRTRPMALDTVQVDLDARQVYLTWRTCFAIEENVQSLTIQMKALP